MAELYLESLDVSVMNNKAICELGEMLWDLTSTPTEEQDRINQKLYEIEDSLLESMDPEQKVLFNHYQDEVDELLILNQKQRFICGFKVAMRLARESMK